MIHRHISSRYREHMYSQILSIQASSARTARRRYGALRRSRVPRRRRTRKRIGPEKNGRPPRAAGLRISSSLLLLPRCSGRDGLGITPRSINRDCDGTTRLARRSRLWGELEGNTMGLYPPAGLLCITYRLFASLGTLTFFFFVSMIHGYSIRV